MTRVISGKTYRIKSKVRFTIFMAILTVFSITCLGNMMGTNDVVSMSEEPVYSVVKVCSGDTLWDLARTYGNPDQDVRETVYAICAANNMTSSDLQAGQTIRIPN